MERSPELEELIRAWFEAATGGDSSLVERNVSRHEGNRLIGSDPGEWLGGQAVADFLRGEAEGSGGNVRFAPPDTEAFREGTVGWAATRLTITLRTESTWRLAGARCSIKRMASGSSCRRTRRSPYPTRRSAGYSPADPQGHGSSEGLMVLPGHDQHRSTSHGSSASEPTSHRTTPPAADLVPQIGRGVRDLKAAQQSTCLLGGRCQVELLP
jgi:hypothetical protein